MLGLISMDHSVLMYEWSCPSCTFSNKPGSFKCQVCGTPKGTATRQTKYHTSTVEQQFLAETMSQRLHGLQAARAANTAKNQSDASSSSGVTEAEGNGSITNEICGTSSRTHPVLSKKINSQSPTTKAALNREEYLWPRLKNINRSTGKSCEITVDNLSILITEYDMLHPDSD